jgi:hypothetical protein
VIRPIAAILAALHIAAPSFEPKRAAAEFVQGVAIDHDFDPLTQVALVEHEARWNPHAVNRKSGTIGLGQIQPRNFAGCREDWESNQCQAYRESLEDWRSNLLITGALFARWREFCRTEVGSARAVHWLSGYGGYDARNGTRCGHRRVGKRWVPAKVPAGVRWILARRADLARRVG